MELFALEDFTKGWFVGAFVPTVLSSDAVEVAVKRYKAGEFEPAHVHRIATELTCVVAGKVRMNDMVLTENTIVLVRPGEAVEFEALTDSINVVVKLPSLLGDKYSLEEGK